MVTVTACKGAPSFGQLVDDGKSPAVALSWLGFIIEEEIRASYAENGGVLVSPFISPAEKRIRDQALAVGGSLIILRAEGFPERFKPSGYEFELCDSGSLLLLAPWPYSSRKNTITRSQALSLNAMAEQIAAISSEPVVLVQD